MYYSDPSFDRAQQSYERARAAGPPETPTIDVTVDYEVYVRADKVSVVTDVLGGHAHWAASPLSDGFRHLVGSTLVEEVETAEDAEDIVHNLVAQHLNLPADLDSLVTYAETIEPEELDHDAIAKDRRIEEDQA